MWRQQWTDVIIVQTNPISIKPIFCQDEYGKASVSFQKGVFQILHTMQF